MTRSLQTVSSRTQFPSSTTHGAEPGVSGTAGVLACPGRTKRCLALELVADASHGCAVGAARARDGEDVCTMHEDD